MARQNLIALFLSSSSGALLGNAATAADGRWSFLASGVNTTRNITVTAVDLAGNSSQATNPQSPPVRAITSFSPDTGVASDHITDVNSITLTGTAVANAIVKVYDGAKLLGTTSANRYWRLELYPTSALSNGAHSLTATATDADGSTSAASSAFTVTINANTTVVNGNLANDTGLSSADGITWSPALTGSADPNGVVHFSVDGNPIAQTATANASGVWSFTPTGLADGAHTIMASDTDAAGNTGAASLAFTLDTTAPLVSDRLLSDTGSSSTDENHVKRHTRRLGPIRTRSCTSRSTATPLQTPRRPMVAASGLLRQLG